MTVEPGSILAFNPGHCEVWQEDIWHVVECCSCYCGLVACPLCMVLYSLLLYVFEAQFAHSVACFPDLKGTVITQGHYAFVTS